MTNSGAHSGDADSLNRLMPQLTDLMDELQAGQSDGVSAHLIEALSAASDTSNLLSMKEVVPAVLSVLSYLQANGLKLDKKISSLLSHCVSVIVKDIKAVLSSKPFDTYEKERDRVFTRLSVYVAEVTGFDLQYYDDAVMDDFSTVSELEYLDSVLSSGGKAQPETATKPAGKASKAKPARPSKAVATKRKQQETTRVKSYLLDRLMSQSEELVQIRNTLADIAERTEDQEIQDISHKLTSISGDILDDLLRTRMRPIGVLLSKYRRIVRDLSRDLGKKISLQIIGENIELDSNVIDAITEPLTHLVRNSVDHGIELPDVRLKAGKYDEGLLTIHAYNESGKVIVSISDDGQGVDTEKVLAKAVESGLVSEHDAKEMSHKDKLDLIFNSGLSTSDKVSAVSGRGVGMDAVRRKVEEIKGAVEINSEFGKGSEVLLRFPLTMATIKVSLFKINGISYAIPSSDISQIIRFSKKEDGIRVRFDKSQILLHRNQSVIPLIEPADYIDNIGTTKSIQEVYQAGGVINAIVFKHMGRDWGLYVDEVFAFMDIVIKPMETGMNPAQLFAGVAVLGNGDLALIVNLKSLLHIARNELVY
ncbi:MAG: chemotaxis protein CheW [Kordiimonadaceae bacterium]|nr:chemotaxis protein CheW [Kordiimonadaceae bacterium]